MQPIASDLGTVPHWSMHQRMMSCRGCRWVGRADPASAARDRQIMVCLPATSEEQQTILTPARRRERRRSNYQHMPSLANMPFVLGWYSPYLGCGRDSAEAGLVSGWGGRCSSSLPGHHAAILRRLRGPVKPWTSQSSWPGALPTSRGET